MTFSCQQCGAKCCRYFCFQIDTPDEYPEFENIRWYLCHEGVTVHIDEDGDWFMQVENICKHLDKNNQCSIYEDRPLICRSYSHDECEETGGEYMYEKEFKTPAEIEAYARKELGDEVFDKEMVNHRAKAEGVTLAVMRNRIFGPSKRTKSQKKTKS